jgi:hypothetical protein
MGRKNKRTMDMKLVRSSVGNGLKPFLTGVRSKD